MSKQIEIELPTLHPGQIQIYKAGGRLNAVRCGRRFGKTMLMVTMAAEYAILGKKVGLFTPEHKQLQEPYEQLLWMLQKVKHRASKTEGTIRLTTGGLIDFWSLTDNELAGRGREYDLVMIDEAAFTKDHQMVEIWRKSIVPTMATRPNASAWVFSTPNGNNPNNFFWKICNPDAEIDEKQKLDFTQHYAKSASNPHVLPEEIERYQTIYHPNYFKQEFLAEFIDWDGNAFFLEEWMLDKGKPVEFPLGCDSVLAVVDTAVKTGSDNDGTAVSFYAVMPSWFDDYRLVILDWDIIQIQGALLEVWIKGVFSRLDELARECRATFGSLGAYIEDAQSGSILLQQCAFRGLPAEPLPAQLTAVGKDGRAINVSSQIYQGKVKWSRHAIEKTVPYKGIDRNHFRSQIGSFRLGDKNAAKRADDLLDTLTYAVAITLGDSEGIA